MSDPFNFLPGNQVTINKGNPVLDIRSPRFARINENVFNLADWQWPVNVTDKTDAPAGPVAVTGNFIIGSKKVIKSEMPSGNKVVLRENLCTDLHGVKK
jgi:hypothetical protein